MRRLTATSRAARARPRAKRGSGRWMRGAHCLRMGAPAFPREPGPRFDGGGARDAAAAEPMITYGTNPGMVIPIGGAIPQRPGDAAFAQALAYMGLTAGQAIRDQPVNVVF